MRKLITSIAAVSILATGAMASVAGAQTNAFAPTSAYAIGPDGFKAWQDGDVKDITANRATIPVKFNKDLSKTWGPGIVGIRLARGGDWTFPEVKWVLFTTGDEGHDFVLGKNSALSRNTTYTYELFVEYNGQRYYGETSKFTTKG